MSDTQMEQLPRDDEPTVETLLQSVPTEIDDEPTGENGGFDDEDTKPEPDLDIAGGDDGAADA